MATLPYFVVGPTALLSIIGLIHGPDKVKPTPKEEWQTAIVDVIIPTHNEQHNITLCLNALAKQTLRPRCITLIDDNSDDGTVRYAAEFSQKIGLDLHIIKRDTHSGKTPSLAYGAQESDADVEFILDGDTILESNNYIERLVQELYQGVGIASACGVVMPFREIDYHHTLKSNPTLNAFQTEFPQTRFALPKNRSERLGQMIVNTYRGMLYQFLQRFIYLGEMVFFGSIINPVGCAVAYRRKYIQMLFDGYANTLGFDLTTSEDIFIGFNFIAQGYRNVQLQDVFAKTKEPSLSQLPRQIFLWSSSFLQSCYYFPELLKTPLKALGLWSKKRREKRDPQYQMILARRKIQESYRQPFGEQYTQRYGRPMGWYIVTTAIEKICFPPIMLALIIFQRWEPLFITVLAEFLLFSIVGMIFAKPNERAGTLVKSILISPIRYVFLFFDLYVTSVFFYEVLTRKNRKWRK